MKQSIFIKIVSGYFVIILILSLAIFFSSFSIMRNYHLQTLRTDLTKVGKTVSILIAPLFGAEKRTELDRLVKKTGADINTRITIVDHEGDVIADSKKDPQKMENHKARSEIILAFQGEVASSLRYSTTLKESMLYVALPYYEQGKVIAVVRLSLLLSDINLILNDLKKRCVQVTLIISFIALLAAYAVASKLTQPIRKLGEASMSVASGNFETRVFLKGKDELTVLADSFNVMTGKIRSLFEEVSIQKEELNNIISSMNEGLLLIDKDNRISLVNESLKNITGIENVEGKPYWEVIREQKLGELIKKAQQEKRTSLQDIVYKDRTFLCSAKYINVRQEILLTFLDISELKNIERMKRDFAVNVSHELRTPLTAIKGFIETMADENQDSGMSRYLDIVNRHTDRLINIVKDLVSLAELEEKQDLELQSTDVPLLARQIMDVYQGKLKDSNISIDLSFEGKPYDVLMDPFKLEQVFINLIDNAIKYTEKGSINVNLIYTEDSLELSFKDSGIGIAKENLTKIFERFYVVDKSRSRSVGGTGLGLSIVKHIILLHNGTINVESTPGRGTCIKVLIPTC